MILTQNVIRISAKCTNETSSNINAKCYGMVNTKCNNFANEYCNNAKRNNAWMTCTISKPVLWLGQRYPNVCERYYLRQFVVQAESGGLRRNLQLQISYVSSKRHVACYWRVWWLEYMGTPISRLAYTSLFQSPLLKRTASESPAESCRLLIERNFRYYGMNRHMLRS